MAIVFALLANDKFSVADPRNSDAPAQATLYVSRRCITGLTAETDGAITAWTTGGTLHRDTDGWHDGAAQAAPPHHALNPSAPTIDKVGNVCLYGRPLPFPTGSTGTHVSAAIREGDRLLCAVYGDDALYSCSADTTATKPAPFAWTRQPTGLPSPTSSEITALAETDGVVCIGTRRSGIWERARQPLGAWQSVALSLTGPFDDDAEAMATYHGSLYVSTLEDGLVVFDGAAWTHLAAPTLSSDAPRQMVVFGDALYVRHGNGVVDRLANAVWTRNVWAGQLPRKEVSALATEGTTLYAAQWGGWSAWDGTRWTHHLTEPALQGLPITALLPDGPTLWVGTQGRGLAEADTQTGAIRRWHDTRLGMPDDWITCLARDGDTLYAGTFVGGVARYSAGESRWTVAPGTAGENATDFALLGPGRLVAATRHGLRTVGPTSIALPESVTNATVEGQSLCQTGDGGLWLGTRRGIWHIQN